MARRREFRSPWVAVAAAGGAIGVLGIAALAVRRPARGLPGPRRIALIGDSYAVGLGPELAKFLPAFRYEGRVGISESGWMHCADCATWLPSFQPSLVLVSLGANDGAAASAADYQALVRALHGIGARVAWVEPPAGLATANAARDAIASLGVPTVPATRVPLGPDGVHPVSYAPWAREIARGIG